MAAILAVITSGCFAPAESTPSIGPDYAGVAPMYGVDVVVLSEIVRGLVDEDLAEEHDGDAEVLAALRKVAEGLPRPVPLHEATSALVVFRRKGLMLDDAAIEARRQIRMNAAVRAIEGK